MLFEKRSFAKSTPNADLFLPDDLKVLHNVPVDAWTMFNIQLKSGKYYTAFNW